MMRLARRFGGVEHAHPPVPSLQNKGRDTPRTRRAPPPFARLVGWRKLRKPSSPYFTLTFTVTTLLAALYFEVAAAFTRTCTL